MDRITKVKSISIWVFIIPFVALNACLILITQFHGLFNDQDVIFNDTEPTSSVFSIGNTTDVNNNGTAHIAYCFTEKVGYSRFGDYTGNGSTDGPFIYTGFQPAWVMVKSVDAAGNWFVMDSTRSDINVSNEIIFADLNAAEDTSNAIDFLSNGFKIVNGSDGSTIANDVNYNTGVILYLAFANSPFKFGNAF